MAYTPLTKEQYQKAIDAGFTSQQIIANEKQRKASSGPTSIATKTDPFNPLPVQGAKGGNPTDLLPTAGAIVGGLGGGIAGAAAAGVPSLGVGAVPGAFLGGVAGAGAGAAAGEALKEKLQGSPLSAGNIAKTGAEYGALEAVGGPVASLAGKVVEAGGKQLATMFIPKSEAEAGLLQTYKAAVPFVDRVKGILGFGDSKAPTTAGSAAFNQGVMGPESWMGVQAKRAQTKLYDNLIGPALKQSKEKVDMPSFFKDAEAQIVKDNADPTRQKSLMTALNAIKKDFSGVGKITMEQLQKYKEGWAKWVPQKAYKGADISASINDVRDTLAGQARQKIYTTLGDNVKQAYLDYGNLHGITALGRKAMANGMIKPGGTFTGIKGLWDMATIPVGTVGGQAVYKVGQGIEILGKPGARTLREALGFPLGIGATSQSGSTPPGSTPPTAPPQL
ncbi:MAG: hypothetical protein V4436_02200 [Patescibacteria group bacterium]